MGAKLRFTDLMKLLQSRGFKIEDRKQLNKILQKEAKNPKAKKEQNAIQIQSDSEPISIETINEILRSLHQFPVTDAEQYSVKKDRFDIEEGGPLCPIDYETPDIAKEVLEIIQEWWNKYFKDKFIEGELLGVVSQGGFLRGSSGLEDDPLVIHCHKHEGIDVFIGDRGSGKSTCLKMLGLLSECLKQNRILSDTLELLEETDEINDVPWNKHIKNFLIEHDIERYSCFFFRNKQLYSFFVEIDNQPSNPKRIYKHPEGIYALLKFDVNETSEKKWKFMQGISESECGKFFPEMKIFNQGEILRISSENDEEDNLLNKILARYDLYPSLDQARKSMAKTLDSFYNCELECSVFTTVNWEKITTFFDKNNTKIENLRRLLDQNNLEILLTELTQFTLGRFTRANNFVQKLEEKSYIVNIFNTINTFSDSDKDIRDLLSTDLPDGLSEEDYNDLIDSRREFLLISLYLKPILNFLDEKISMIRRSNFPKNKISENFFNANKLLSKIIKVLGGRNSKLKSWTYNLRYLTQVPEDSLGKFLSLVGKQNDLIKEQEKCCKDMTEALAGFEPKIIFYTLSSENDDLYLKDSSQKHENKLTIQANEKSIELVEEYSKTYQSFRSLKNFSHFSKIHKKYSESLNILLSIIQLCLGGKTSDFLYPPIYIVLGEDKFKTGKKFEKLSFGQKSGIILMIALKKTSAKTLVLDQPEDNLDNVAIINIIAPTLLNLSKEKKIIIATHSSNLVMSLGLGNHELYLFVLENLLRYGRIIRTGYLFDQGRMIDVINILEGGPESIQKKVDAYSKFGNMFPQLISARVITTFNSEHFAKLRDFTFAAGNYSSAIANKMNILETMHHELRKQNIEVVDRIKVSDDESAVILKKLHESIKRINEIIEDHESLQSKPKSETLNLYEFLSSLISRDSTWRVCVNLSHNLKEVFIRSDKIHAKYIFINIFRNSIRGIDKKKDALFRQDDDLGESYVGKIHVSSVYFTEINHLIDDNLEIELKDSVCIRVEDNGIGVEDDIKHRLYRDDIVKIEYGKERVTEGGLIISHLLSINNASIFLDPSQTKHGCENGKTVQFLLFQSG